MQKNILIIAGLNIQKHVEWSYWFQVEITWEPKYPQLRMKTILCERGERK
jgi:hypothetical protein